MSILVDNNKDYFYTEVKEAFTEMFDVGAAAVETAKKGKDRKFFSSELKTESILTSL